MNEALAEIILSALRTAETAQEFVLSEMPDVISQLLMWKAAESLIFCIIGLILLVFLGSYWLMVYKRWSKWVADKKDYEFNAAMFGGFATLGLGIVIANIINTTWLQILIAPKVYLIEYAAELLL